MGYSSYDDWKLENPWDAHAKAMGLNWRQRTAVDFPEESKIERYFKHSRKQYFRHHGSRVK